MIVIYTGGGKGKTSACMGQAVRALGRDLDVGFVQFMKQPETGGEQKTLARLLGDRFFSAGGAGFFRTEEQRAEHREAALASLARANDLAEKVDLLVLDESVYALNAGLILRKEMDALVSAARRRNMHLVLSGRNVPQWLLDEADLVSEIAAVKHPFTKGLPAVKGIDF